VTVTAPGTIIRRSESSSRDRSSNLPVPPLAQPQPPPASSWDRVFASSGSAITILATAGIAIHLLLLRFVVHIRSQFASLPLYVVLLLGGLPLLIELIRRLWHREFGSDLLAGISILVSVLQGQYLVGCIVVLMLSGGTALENYTSRRASSVLDKLAQRLPLLAHRKTGSQTADVGLNQVEVGDLLLIYPHEISPVDGIVIEGQGRMNEAFLTGEPFEVAKAPGSKIISGAINGETVLTIQAEKLPIDSRYARIMRVMEQTQQHRPRLRRLGDQLGAWYTPVAILIAASAWAITGDSGRFLAVLVVATPCPLLIAIPVAIVGGIALAARSGIIIKNPAMLEQIDSCRTFIFDKTGTLTYGRPVLTDIVCAPGFEKDQILRAAASLERYSRHPLAQAILNAASQAELSLEAASEINESPGQGLRGVVGRQTVLITGRNCLPRKDVDLPRQQPGLECLVFIDDVFAGLFRFHDAPRRDSRGFVSHLAPRHHVNRVLLVSGDRKVEVQYLASAVGIREVRAGKSPEEKVAIVREESEREKTVFVGDGINDAPAMRAATIGLAFGLHSDITSEAADAVILESSLGKVDELIHIGRRMRSIALESAVGGMGLSILGMVAAASGFLPPIAGAIAQEVIDLLAVLNAVRVAFPGRELRDPELGSLQAPLSSGQPLRRCLECDPHHFHL
jgi:heavy metal translocating P-type ATPase